VTRNKATGSSWKNGQAELFNLWPIDERFINACLISNSIVNHQPYFAPFRPTLSSAAAKKLSHTTDEQKLSIQRLILALEEEDEEYTAISALASIK
jgi:hypothetical protein